MTEYIIRGINPQPWTVGNLSMGRKGGRNFPMISKRAELRNYQDAIAQAFTFLDPAPEMTLEPVALTIYYWRQVEEYRNDNGKLVVKHRADLTNLNKGLEDALQKILFKNDNQVVRFHSEIVEQERDTDPRIVIIIATGDEIVRVQQSWYAAALEDGPEIERHE